MRQIGTVSDASSARTFADYLSTLQIESRLDHQPQGWALWVFDEDRILQAKAELEQFLRDPENPRFTRRGASAARPTVPPPPSVTDEEHDEEVQPQLDLSIRRGLVTLVIGVVCLAVFLGSNLGSPASPLIQALQIAPDGDTTLDHVRHGELWRLVSPIFVHFNPLHLLFNFLMLFDLGRQVERRRGAVRYLLFILIVAILSNILQFYLGDFGWTFGSGFTFQPSGKFGGLSGVLYALFGYIWVKARREPDLGFVLMPGTTALLVSWLFVCLFAADVIGAPVANVAHVAGLFCGLVIGYASYVLNAVRQR
jgi:GlpG protein